MGPHWEIVFATAQKWAMPLVLVLVLLVCVHGTALAHRPIFAQSSAVDPQSAVRIEDPSVSHVIYFELEGREEVQWFVIENDRPREVPIQVGVPMGAARGMSNPVVTLFEPGFDASGASSRGAEIALQGKDEGVIELRRMDVPERFYEPITGTESLIVADTHVELALTGNYYGAVYDADGGEGKAWVAVGRREGFSWRDVPRLPGWIRRARAFHEIAGWPRWVWGAAVGIAAVVVVVLLWKLGRRRSTE